MSDIQIDPGYAYRQQQAELALSRGAAARGAVQGGGFAKDIQRDVQGSASQEYEKAFQRFEQDRQNRFANVKGVSDSGQVASTTAGGNTIGAAQYGGNVGLAGKEYAGSMDVNAADLVGANTIGAVRTQGDYNTQAANAQAAGKVGSANAWSSALSGGANAVSGALNFNQLLKNPGFGWNRFAQAYADNPIQNSNGSWMGGAGPKLPPNYFDPSSGEGNV